MITIVDYNAGNPSSVRIALNAVGIRSRLSSDPEQIREAERILFPGVGAARYAMEQLRDRGLIEALKEVLARGTPFFGICMGMQVLLDFSEEDGGTQLLGIVPGKTRRFSPPNRRDKVPQIGWNDVHLSRNHPVFRDVKDRSFFYFVHSFYAVPAKPEQILGTTHYGGTDFASVIARDNLIATQFHPEKSGPCGLALLKNFSNWKGENSC